MGEREFERGARGAGSCVQTWQHCTRVLICLAVATVVRYPMPVRDIAPTVKIAGAYGAMRAPLAVQPHARRRKDFERRWRAL